MNILGPIPAMQKCFFLVGKTRFMRIPSAMMNQLMHMEGVKVTNGPLLFPKWKSAIPYMEAATPEI